MQGDKEGKLDFIHGEMKKQRQNVSIMAKGYV